MDAFTIGFEDPQWNEVPQAIEIAKSLDLKHHVKMISESDLLQMVDQIPMAYDEPFADPSQIPTLLLTDFARQSEDMHLWRWSR